MVVVQDKFTTVLGKIQPHILRETVEFMQEDRGRRPVFLFLPATYSDATSKAMKHIITELRSLQERHDCIDKIVLGLDQADEQGFNEVNKEFKRIPRAITMWNDAPEMKALYADLEVPLQRRLEPGKGRNLWTALGYRYAVAMQSNLVTHDCDIKPTYYSQETLLSLLAPVVHPLLDFHVSKAYYTRLKKNDDGLLELSGRVRRLLVAPLIDSLNKRYGQGEVREYLDFLRSFRYPLAGEFAMKANLANNVQIQLDWGLEISMLNFLFEERQRIAQVDLGLYDHKHSPASVNDEGRGLHRMAIEVTKTVFRSLHELQAPLLSEKRFDVRVLAKFQKYAERYITKYATVSLNNGWAYDKNAERDLVSMYTRAVGRAFNVFRENPAALSPLPDWKSLDHKYQARLCDVVSLYNPELSADE